MEGSVLEKCNEFSTIYETYYQRVYHAAWKITRDNYLAEDVVQETFIKAYNNIDRLTDDSKIGAWLSTIASRTAIDVLRKEKRASFIPIDEVLFTNYESLKPLLLVDKELETIWSKEDIKQQIVLLSPKLQKVLLLKYQEDIKDEDIAEKLNITLSAVKTRIFRARKIMKQQLKGKEVKETKELEVIA
ncbi:RNA polymerase sigma factor [Aquibacillus rhizosphaerae]|uniref:RNA polymerase sigma factor n=1 Tax=Aquibacillus rhizosphaerae TaxID=3051431 RepID=A0ABT7L8M1_9BACI|nr:RNA polymerase sigma factor [Aquibacillus sp. LR5S19]MDL4842231.1 RNA polymerase sigma factor [Aquibacillus sp. LR5S19]